MPCLKFDVSNQDKSAYGSEKIEKKFITKTRKIYRNYSNRKSDFSE